MSVPPRSPSPAGQDEDQQAFTPLTDTANRAVYTHGLSYTPTLPEYPKSDHDGFTYVIPVPPEKRGSIKEALEIIDVCTILFTVHSCRIAALCKQDS
jgi:hypothetical protein